MPDSCTHIAGECPVHEALRISRHNAACQLVHAAIRKTAKGGGSLHSAPDLVLVMADTGTQPMTTGESLESLSSTAEDNDPYPNPETSPHEWLAPLPTSEAHATGDTPMSLKTSYTTTGTSLPHTETRSAKRPLAAYQIGCSPRARHIRCSKPSITQL